MKHLIIIFIIFFLTNCSKPKTVMICGDHICVNKAEAEQYFEDNLTLEVRIIDKKVKTEIDLVELNLKENDEGNKKISILAKNKTDENLKTLSKEEIINIKKKIKKKIKIKKTKKKIAKKNNIIENKKKIKNVEKKRKLYTLKNTTKNTNVYKNKDVFDVCSILDKCNIDEISKYLLDQGKKKDFPDITKNSNL
jgi:hypothetical protein